jgi:DNA-binding transcriptional MocR family regulator
LWLVRFWFQNGPVKEATDRANWAILAGSVVDVNVLDVLGDWPSLGGPLYRRLATAIRAAIDRGHLPPGSVLPPERVMARSLAVGRATVVAAYDLLCDEQVLESRQGSGTWVSGAGRGRAGGASRESLRGTAPAVGPAIDLATASLPAAPMIGELIGELPGADLDALLDHPGYSPLGLPELRAAIAEMFTADGLETAPHQILVTTGDQQALALLTEHLLAAGDLALVEDPTSAGLLDLLRARLATIRVMNPVATAGPEPAADMLAQVRARLTYLAIAPNPAGDVCPPEHLPPLCRAIDQATGIVVEDTSGRDLSLVPVPPYLAQQAGTHSEATSERVVTVGSMSKLFWGGLRIGWIRASAGLIDRLGRIKARADLGTPLLSQLLAARLLRRRDEVRRVRVAELRASLATAGTTVRGELPEFGWAPPQAGVALWLRLPAGSAAPFTELAYRHGVAVAPGTALSSAGGADDRIRVTYARPPAVFAEGVRRLAHAWRDYRESLTSSAGSRDETWLY